jgi:hypothetical protein
METDLGIDRLLFVKIPVTDVAASARWYARLLDLRLAMEFIEDDELRGVVLVEPLTGIRLALRDRAYSSSNPVLSGFDLFAFEMKSLPALEAFAKRCESLGIASTGVHYFDDGAGMDVPDPDGTAIRFHYAPGRPPFMVVRGGAESGQPVSQQAMLADIPVMQS